MSPLRLLLALAVLGLATGCEIKRTLVVRPDGSGLINEHQLAALDTFETEPKEAPKPGVFEMKQPRPTQAEVEKKAAKFGEGVKLKTFKLVQTKDMLGYDAVFEFPDVNKIRVDAFMQESDGPGESGKEGGPVNFKFTKGAVSELTIPLKGLTGKKGEEKPGPPDDNSDPKQREAFMEAIKHLHMRMAVQVVGTIQETNSHYRAGNEIVLMEMNLKDMSADPKYAQMFKDAASGKKPLPKDPPEDSKYIKNEEAETVKVKFK